MAIDSNSSVLINDRFVAGVTWRRIVARGSVARLALELARQEKATRYSQNGAQPVVGLIRLKGIKADTRLYSLARLLGRTHHLGSVFAAVQIQPGKFWICGVRDGQPLPNFDSIVPQSQVFPLYQTFVDSQATSEEAEIRVLGTISIGLPNITPLDIPELEPATDESCELRPLAKTIPKPVIYAAALGALYLVGSYGWGEYQDYQRREKERQRALQEVDPIEGWKDAYRSWYASQKVYDARGIISVRDHVYDLPLNVGGWALSGGKCFAGDKDWKCVLTYSRSRKLHEGASNRTFEAARRPEWKVLWKPAGDELEASFVFAVAPARLTPADVFTIRRHQIESFSDYQTIAPTFSGMQVGEFKKEAITGPMTMDNQPMPKPQAKGLEDLFRQEITASGPLRNVEFFTRPGLPVYWTTVEFSVGASQDPDAKPDVKVSRFMGTWKGIVYGKAEG